MPKQDVLAHPMATMPASEFRRWLDAEKAKVRVGAMEEAAQIAERVGRNHLHAEQLAGHIAYQIRAAAPRQPEGEKG